MNLALRDIRHSLGRFALTAIGIGMLLVLVMGMGGIYRGLVQDATLLVDSIGVDLWVVQKDTRGPFAELSRIPITLEDRVRAVPGVAVARAFISHTIQREHRGKSIRVTIQGLRFPDDTGSWLPIVAGRAIEQAHYEAIVDESAGLLLGESLALGKDTYTVVGLTRAMSSTSGDAMAFFSLRDAQAIQLDVAAEATRVERATRYRRAELADIGQTQPEVIQRSLGPSSSIPALGTSMVSAILVRAEPGADISAIVATIGKWPDTSVFTQDAQRGLLLHGTVDRARRQLGLFRVLLIIVSALIMALILYTLTLDKLHDIAMLKLMGGRNSVIVGLILQQALLLGAIGFGFAYYAGGFLFPKFPRRVVIFQEDLIQLAVIVAGISVAASLLGIWRALRVDAGEVIA